MIYEHPRLQAMYHQSPPVMQHLFMSVYGLMRWAEGWRAGARRLAAELDRTQWWSPNDLRELQAERLRVLVRHAYENVPYYRRVFSERKLTPADIRAPDDLYKLPVLTRPVVRQCQAELRARGVPRHQVAVTHTGGTTGIPMPIMLDNTRLTFDHEVTRRHWGWAGCRVSDRNAVLRGAPLVSTRRPTRTYWRYDWISRRMYLSGYHLSRDTLPVYIERLQAWRPKFIAAYPSSVHTLACYMETVGVVLPLRAVFTSSEVLTPAERAMIEKQFACRVWDRYGTAERLAVSQQCEHGRYHQNVEYGLMQVEDERGEPCPPGVAGRVMQTGLTNFSMPLIRYAVDDVGYAEEAGCACGRGLPSLGPVVGRKDDVIVASGNRLMPRVSFENTPNGMTNIERCQLVQTRVGELTVRVLARPGFGAADEAELKRRLKVKLGPQAEVNVKVVDSLETTASGKFRYIISKVDLEALTGLKLSN